MSWLIHKKGDKFRIYSTFVDRFITDWIGRRETLRHLHSQKWMAFKKEIVKLHMLFPHNCNIEPGGKIHINRQNADKFHKWLTEMSLKSPDDKLAELDKRFQEALEYMKGN